MLSLRISVYSPRRERGLSPVVLPWWRHDERWTGFCRPLSCRCLSCRSSWSCVYRATRRSLPKRSSPFQAKERVAFESLQRSRRKMVKPKVSLKDILRVSQKPQILGFLTEEGFSTLNVSTWSLHNLYISFTSCCNYCRGRWQPVKWEIYAFKVTWATFVSFGIFLFRFLFVLDFRVQRLQDRLQRRLEHLPLLGIGQGRLVSVVRRFTYAAEEMRLAPIFA